MPGVPSSRGCKACRAQKKKCDQQKPSCSRCSRLKIDCIEGGQQRFKFVGQGPNQQSSTSPQLAPSSNSTAVIILPSLTSTSMSISNDFISTLGMNKLEFQLTTMGAHLFWQIPQRVGSNEAFDASVQAMTSARYSLKVRGSQINARAKYGRALSALRKCLQDPEKASTASTLCAIFLLSICQGWVARKDVKYGNHAEGLSHVLNAFADSYDWSNVSSITDFDLQLIFVCTMSVLCERISNPRVRLGPWLRKAMGPFGPRRRDPPFLPSLTIRSIDQLTKYLQDPAPHRLGIEIAYRDLSLDVASMRGRIAELDQEMPSDHFVEGKPLPAMIKAFGHHVQYGMLLPFAALINHLLRSFPPREGQPKTQDDDAAFYVNEICKLADSAQCFRPLGTEWVPSTLCVAWATTSDPNKQIQLEGMIRDYNKDIPDANSMPVAIWTKRWLKKQRATLSGNGSDEGVSVKTDADLEAAMGPASTNTITDQLLE
ncbi:hypothetical protein BDV96DRAFT_641911 [Lophiotrema nucula]|uniref:Zn(2)-C6 fungal-type domain-containing protein n=1 Tax=Lophiotrema nucula TaxID=690887 RepID=A0A6A5ZP70_9PLEO|nr:hypothetical protein BDV96DRAFT_641911 [Lophiotrema nucula]